MATCNCTGACMRYGTCYPSSAGQYPNLNTSAQSITERCRCGSEISLVIGFFDWRAELDGWRERHASHFLLATEETENA